MFITVCSSRPITADIVCPTDTRFLEAVAASSVLIPSPLITPVTSLMSATNPDASIPSADSSVLAQSIVLCVKFLPINVLSDSIPLNNFLPSLINTLLVNLFIAPEIKLIAECSSVHEPFNKFVVFVHSRTLLAKLPSNPIILDAIEPILLNALIIVVNVFPIELIANLTISIAFDTIEIIN